MWSYVGIKREADNRIIKNKMVIVIEKENKSNGSNLLPGNLFTLNTLNKLNRAGFRFLTDPLRRRVGLPSYSE